MTPAAILKPSALFAGGIVLALFLIHSQNLLLWLGSFGALVGAVWLTGGRRSPPALAWVLVMFWLAIAGDLLVGELTGIPLSATAGGFGQDATLISLCALLVLALGMRCGLSWPSSLLRRKDPGDEGFPQGASLISIQRAAILYVVTLTVSTAAGRFASQAPGLAQIVLALSLLKFAAIYVIAFKVLSEDRGYPWLLLILGFEIVAGSISYWSGYKEAVFIVLIAFLSVERKMPARNFVLGLGILALVFWMSLVWSEVKKEYRGLVPDLTLTQQLAWMGDRYFGGDIDYSAALVSLAQRVGYTSFLAQVMLRDHVGALAHGFDFYGHALKHILTPRLLFPDKAPLDDSKLTTALIGAKIPVDTSISVGYVTQGYVDFGFPLLLLPIWFIGLLLGGITKYFLSSSAPYILRSAFASSLIFAAFRFESDIDKALGGFITQSIVMLFLFSAGYPALARWLRGPDARPRLADRPLARTW